MDDSRYPNNTQIVEKDGIEIHILRETCIGAATCVVYAPSTFELDDSNITINNAGDWDKLEKVVAAAVSCPVIAIEVYKDGQKQTPIL